MIRVSAVEEALKIILVLPNGLSVNDSQSREAAGLNPEGARKVLLNIFISINISAKLCKWNQQAVSDSSCATTHLLSRLCENPLLYHSVADGKSSPLRLPFSASGTAAGCYCCKSTLRIDDCPSEKAAHARQHSG
jgi:hypothetical protein